jgi:predicted peroxiredoxin
MSNVVIVCSCGTDNPNRSTRALHLATIAHKEGKEVVVFLLDEGVFLAREGLVEHLRAATGDVADDLLAYLQAHDIPLLACTPCAKARRITEADLVEGARMATAAELFRLSEGATMISL